MGSLKKLAQWQDSEGALFDSNIDDLNAPSSSKGAGGGNGASATTGLVTSNVMSFKSDPQCLLRCFCKPQADVPQPGGEHLATQRSPPICGRAGEESRQSPGGAGEDFLKIGPGQGVLFAPFQVHIGSLFFETCRRGFGRSTRTSPTGSLALYKSALSPRLVEKILTKMLAEYEALTSFLSEASVQVENFDKQLECKHTAMAESEA